MTRIKDTPCQTPAIMP